MSTKTLRVSLADIRTATGEDGSTATVVARYVDTRKRGRDIHLTDGTIVVPVRRTVDAAGTPEHFDFTVYPTDDPEVREVDWGFLVEVAWKVTSPEGGTSSGTRVVQITSDMAATVSLGTLATPTPMPPYSGGYATPETVAAMQATIDALADPASFATAAQGVKADTAVQPAALTAYAVPGAAAAKTRLVVKKMFNAMQAPTGFTKFSGTGTIADDATDYVLGTSSLKVVTDGTTTTHIATRTGLGPYDFTGLVPVIWVKVSDMALLTELSVYLSSDNFVTYYTWKLDTTPAARALILNGEWVAVTLPFRSSGVTGSPNRAAITSVRFRVKSSGPVVTANFGGIAGAAEPPHAVVSVSFDDGKNDQFTTALPIMSKYGIPATSFVICDRVGDTAFDYLTVDQMREMERLHGWEFAVHAGTDIGHTDDFPVMTEDGIAAEFAHARTWMLANGFPGGADIMAYPHGDFDAKTMRQARRFFAAARTICEENHETFPPGDPHRLRIYNMLNTRTAANVTAEIDRAITNKTWLILLMHRIVAPGTDDIGTEYPTDDLDTVMAYLRTSGVEVRTIGDVIRNGIT